MLIVLGGLPGSGKTTVARLLAQHLRALHLRIDTIEQALRGSGISKVGVAGYVIAQRIAADNLRLGQSVIADCVNPVRESRAAWHAVATETGVPIVEIELVCSDPAQHRKRIETRTADIPGHVLPDWEDVQTLAYEPWPGAVRIDTAGRSSEETVAAVLTRISGG
jgi:predicted kinase